MSYLFRDYEFDYGSHFYRGPRFDPEQFVFLEEAKEFVQLLQAMKRHPIKPSAEIFRIQLESDIAAFNNLGAQERNIDAEILKKVPESSKLVSDFEACDDEASDTSQCPTWQAWGEWSECTGCGRTFELRARTGCLVNGGNVELTWCQAEP